MVGKLDGQVAVVTGAASGIGAAAAMVFAAEGAAVAALDVDVDGAEETAAKVRAGGSPGLAVRVNVADPGEVVAAMVSWTSRRTSARGRSILAVRGLPGSGRLLLTVSA